MLEVAGSKPNVATGDRTSLSAAYSNDKGAKELFAKLPLITALFFTCPCISSPRLRFQGFQTLA